MMIIITTFMRSAPTAGRTIAVRDKERRQRMPRVYRSRGHCTPYATHQTTHSMLYHIISPP